MEDISFRKLVTISAIKSQAWHCLEPIIVLGKFTMKDLEIREEFPYTDENGYDTSKLYGFDCAEGDFDYGFLIHMKI
jgi:hypothetical protein